MGSERRWGACLPACLAPVESLWQFFSQHCRLLDRLDHISIFAAGGPWALLLCAACMLPSRVTCSNPSASCTCCKDADVIQQAQQKNLWQPIC